VNAVYFKTIKTIQPQKWIDFMWLFFLLFCVKIIKFDIHGKVKNNKILFNSRKWFKSFKNINMLIRRI